MPKKLTGLIALMFLLQVFSTGSARAQTQPAPSSTAVPLNQYLMPDKGSEIALARSAAPPTISDKAEVLVLAPGGYTTAVTGTNGFVCLVERGWAKTTDDPEFWSPKISAPICVNAPAARTYLPIVMLKTNQALAGKSRTEIASTLKSAWERKELPALEPDAMCYMMSKQQYLSDDDMHWHPHMMWFVPGDAAQSWGANLAGVPAIAGYVPQDGMTVFLIKVGRWSDGSVGPQGTH